MIIKINQPSYGQAKMFNAWHHLIEKALFLDNQSKYEKKYI